MYCYIYLLLGANYQNKKSDNLTKTETQIVLAGVYCISTQTGGEVLIKVAFGLNPVFK